MPQQMGKAELMDLVNLLQGLLHPDLDQRLSIANLVQVSSEQTRWLNRSLYKSNQEQEIALEMQQRIYSSQSL